MTRAWAIGVDVGGTKIAAAAVDSLSAEVIFRRQVETRPERPPAEVVAAIVEEIDNVAAELRVAGNRVCAIGVGVPELVSPAGEILTPYLLDWTATPLPGEIASLPVRVASDVRAAALAEARFGAGRGYRQFIYVSIGTGISSTLVIDGVPFTGAHGGAVVLTTGPISVPDDHGGWTRFVLEEYASGRALAERFASASNRDVSRTSAQDVLAAAEAGDNAAIVIVDSSAEALGSALGWLVNVLDPEALVIGGGLGLAPGRYHEQLITSTRAHIWNVAARQLPITQAALGHDAGVIGAALAALSAQLMPGGDTGDWSADCRKEVTRYPGIRLHTQA